MKAKFNKVGVLMGGWSSESDISLRSGKKVLEALQQSGIDAFAFNVTTESFARLGESEMDCAFIILHGRGGEDGTIQAMLKVLNIPFTGSGVLASGLSMNKVIAKQIWHDYGIPTPRFVVPQSKDDTKRLEKVLGFPYALKPVDEGSSIGVSRVDSIGQVDEAWKRASDTGRDIMAECWISGDEYAVGFVAGEALPPIRLETPRTFYDYTAKYKTDTTRYHCPCGLPDAKVKTLQSICLDACVALGIEGWGRADMKCDEDGDFYVLEINTIPGMTDQSLLPMAAKQQGIGYSELVIKILNTARRHNR